MDEDDAPSPFDSEENLSISIDTFFKILDEEPSPPTQGNTIPFFSSSSPGTVKSLYQDDRAPGQVKCEKDFHPQTGMLDPTPAMGDLRRPGTSLWASSNCLAPLDYYSNDWLSLSTSEDNTLMDSVAGSMKGLISDDIDYQQFENDMRPCGASHQTAERAGFLYPTDPDPVNGLYLDSNQEKDFVQMEDSSHNMLETAGFNDSMHVDMNNSTMPASTIEEGNVYAVLSTTSSAVPDITLPDTIYTSVDTRVAKDSVCNARNSYSLLQTCDAQTASMQISHDQFFQPFSLRETGAMIHRRDEGEVRQLLLQNSCMTSEVKLGTHEESLGTPLPVASVIDFDETFPEILCDDQIHCEVLAFNNESSTDSSPVPSSRNSTSDNVDRSVVNTAKQSVPESTTIIPNMKQKALSKDRGEDWIPASRRREHDITISSNGATPRVLSESSLSVDDDADICILDDISDPARPPPPPHHMKLQSMSQRSEFSDSYYHGSGLRLKADDERLTLRVALQDLSQPKSEASPPIGVLNVPLLRHQRIALSWMVQKETGSLHCSGGILADDQGLGKTISTIALILMERSPPSRSYFAAQKPDQLEPLNVDDDDDDNDGFSDLKVMKQLKNSTPVMMSRPTKRENYVTVAKGRPAAGTLVVCPTSVLRQWADELQNKVSSKANLSFLMYYGSNRTKDPNELAKYDVVLTTYAIVSMEVPKQPLVDKDEEEIGKVDASRLHSGLSTSNKRKNSQNSNSRNKDCVLLESSARPLARVGWFRVVLDEAQSIKNYRTQVARACWGLRAKRRWCLSGTPIQNAVDDLYSYFRFLRYDPYAVYKSFCSLIKVPISRNPTTGYQKLQLVLKTIMLRRTKGTLLDGKPIINLPPKTVTLKKVDFSEEERAFYSTLEAESREQFKEYAAAGTVKQNYVNILLMLLRLRQACDHPLLVKAYDSNSTGRSSMDMVKKLPRDEQVNLLSCLEACFAICTICNDPPEDAVVTICGHVFCNQCICEHLTGDDNICPSAHCKMRLTVASVFSRGTLKSCLSDQSDNGHSSRSSVSHMSNMPNTCEQSPSSDSSKIKTALEILQSLPICHGSTRSNLESCTERSNGSVVNAVNTIPVTCSLETDSKFSYPYKPSKGQATEKAIVFSQWTRMLDLLEVPLKASCIQYRRLDGTMSVVARDKAVKDFNTQPEVTVMIMSLKAASLGLNMVTACHVLLLDLWWNPTTEDQAIDRAHRIGQTRPVTVSRLTVRDTVEDRILALQEKKREMVASAFGEDEAGTRQSRLTVEDLKYLFMA